jgi:hypothetical protein
MTNMDIESAQIPPPAPFAAQASPAEFGDAACEIGHHHPDIGQHSHRSGVSRGMRRSTTTEHDRGFSFAIAVIAAVWMAAGIAMVIAVDGGLTRVAALLAIVITEWWLVSLLEDRFVGNAVGRKAAIDHVSSAGPRAA